MNGDVCSAIGAWTLFACTRPTDRALAGWNPEGMVLDATESVLRGAAREAGR